MLKTKKGFLIVKNKKGSKELFRKNGVYVMKSYIPHTYTSSTIVYFVSGSNGDEFGQYPTRQKALMKARKMSKLNIKDRKKFDE